MNDPNGGPATSPNPPLSDDMRAMVAEELAKLRAQRPAPAPTQITYAPKPQVLDLDEQIAEVDLSPRSVKVGGEVYRIRRDLTSPEVVALLQLVRDGKDLEFLTAILSGDGAAATRLNDYLDSIPFARSQIFMQRIGSITGLPGMGVEMGEVSAR